MDDLVYLLTVFVVMMVISFGQRALPFIASSWLQKQTWARYIGQFLPLAIMLLLVLHSAINAAVQHEGLPIPEVLAIVTTLVLQWFVKNSLLSIFSGTLVYVLLLNSFFMT